MQARHEPETSRVGPWLSGWYLLVPIIVLSVAREWWAPDEPRYAEIAKEVFEAKSFMVMHLCGELYPDKPPLVYWLSGLMGRLSGWSEFWMRVPSILATAGSAWMCMRIARRWMGELEAQWVVPLYLGTVMVLEIGGRLQLDPILSFCVLAAIDQLSIAPREEDVALDVGADASRSRVVDRAIVRRTLVAGAWMGVGALAKGPVAWIPVAFALLAWRWLPKPMRFAPRRGARAWIGLVLLSILPVAIWAALAIHEEPALMKPLLFGQHIGRITEANKHAGPVWDHLLSMPLLLLPWTLLVVSGLAHAWRAWRRSRASKRDAPTDANAHAEVGLVRIAAWFALVFVFFSIIPPKRDLYLLPIYPAAALLGAFELARAVRVRRLPGWIGWTTASVMLVLGLVLSLAPFLVNAWVDQHTDGLDELGDDLVRLAPLIVPVGIVLALSAVAALIGQTFRSPRTWANALALGLATSITVAAIRVVPSVDEVKSTRPLAEMLHARPERPTQIACIGVRPEGLRFYGAGPAASEPLVPALERERDQFLGVTDDKSWDRMSPQDRARFRTLGELRLGRHSVRVLGKAGD